MFVDGFYVPILTGKDGELRAIGALADEVGFTPFLDIPPIPRPRPPARGAINPESKKPKDPAAVLDRLVERLSELWGSARRVIVDLNGLERYRPGGVHPVDYFCARAEEAGLLIAIAVSNLSSPSYRAAARALGLSGDRLVLRFVLPQHPVGDPGATYAELVEDVAAGAGISDLVIDLGRLDTGAPATGEALAASAKSILAARPPRSVALSSTSIPDLSTLGSKTFCRVERNDWRVWGQVREHFDRQLAFSDYGITGPRRDTDHPVWSGPSPHLRYSRDNMYYLWKGDRGPGDGAPPERGMSYPELCAKLYAYRSSGRQVFRGRSFSPGDKAIWECATGQPRAAGSSQWVEYATSHHLKEVLEQLQGRT